MLQHACLQGTVVASALTSDQTPYRADERQRIRAAGGVVRFAGSTDSRAPLQQRLAFALQSICRSRV